MANPAPDPLMERQTSGFEIQRRDSATLNLTIWGDLGLGWFGRLSTAVARRGLSIQSAQATRTETDDWTATVELSTASAIGDSESLNYLELSNEQPVGRKPEPTFSRFRIDRTSAGTLELRFAAHDQPGLLSALLDHLEFLGLFPERFRVTTQGQRVEDILWLRGVAGNRPSEQAEEALHQLMARSTRPTE